MSSIQISRKISFPTGEIEGPFAVGLGRATTVTVVLETKTETDVTVTVIAACVGHEGMEIIVELASNIVVSTKYFVCYSRRVRSYHRGNC